MSTTTPATRAYAEAKRQIAVETSHIAYVKDCPDLVASAMVRVRRHQDTLAWLDEYGAEMDAAYEARDINAYERLSTELLGVRVNGRAALEEARAIVASSPSSPSSPKPRKATRRAHDHYLGMKARFVMAVR